MSKKAKKAAQPRKAKGPKKVQVRDLEPRKNPSGGIGPIANQTIEAG